MNKEKKYPQEYTGLELSRKINEYADRPIGSDSSEKLMQAYTKAQIGIAEVQKRDSRTSIYIAFAAFIVALLSLLRT